VPKGVWVRLPPGFVSKTSPVAELADALNVALVIIGADELD